MSLVIYEPFEFWPPRAEWFYPTEKLPNMLASGISGMDGRCLNIGATSGTDTAYLVWTLPSPLATVYLTFLYRPVNTYSGGNEILTFRDASGNVQAQLRRDSSGYLWAQRGWGAANLGSSSNIVANNTTRRIDVKYKPHDTDGIFQVWISTPGEVPTLEIDATGVDTTDYAGNVAQLRLGEQGGHTDIPVNGYIDCFAVDDAEIPGLIKAKVLLPNEAGYLGQFSQLPNSGEPYDKVDDQGRMECGEINYADAIYSDVADKIHAFGLTTLEGTGIDQIVAVMPVSLVAPDLFSTPRNHQVGLRSGGNNYFSDSLLLLPSERRHDGGCYDMQVCSKMWFTDPADSGAWTISRVNALELLVKTVA